MPLSSWANDLTVQIGGDGGKLPAEAMSTTRLYHWKNVKPKTCFNCMEHAQKALKLKNIIVIFYYFLPANLQSSMLQHTASHEIIKAKTPSLVDKNLLTFFF